MGLRTRTVRVEMQGMGQNGRRRQGPNPPWACRTEAGVGWGWSLGGTEMGEVAGRDQETTEMCVRDGGGSVGAGPGAPIPRLLVITCPEEAAGS